MKGKIKSFFTNLSKRKEFNLIINKIAFEEKLNDSEESLFLTVAILFNEEYNKTGIKPYFEFAYYLILKYSILTKKFLPLYDFSINNGFYPIACFLQRYSLVEETFEMALINDKLGKYNYNGIIETKEQKHYREEIISSSANYKSYIAPTSFGKSSLIIEDIISKLNTHNKIGIIVPKRSLIWQNYRDLIKIKQKSHKIIMHDKTYDGEEKVICVLTQERALRLLNLESFNFDVLYIDEAHNIFEKDDRNVLLARLIRLNKLMNNNQKVLYLSPLINDKKSLMIDGGAIEQFKIDFNIKEYDIYYLDKDNNKYFYSRFLNSHTLLENNSNNYMDYIIKNSKNKNLIYISRPLKIEEFALEFSNAINEDVDDIEIIELCKLLEENLHPSFYNINCIKKGVVYIHGKMPDFIKEYLEYKYRTCNSIKYLISNSVILEGVNLPIESIFIMDNYLLNEQSLFNLIGRANRLNDVFNDKFSPEKLLVPIHLIESQYSSNSMKNKLDEFRDSNFNDVIKNPLLDNSHDEDKQNIKESENKLMKLVGENDDSIEKILLSNGMNSVYKDLEYAINIIKKNIETINQEKEIDEVVNKIFNKIHKIFFSNFNYIQFKDYEVARLINEEAINYYERYVLYAYHKPIKQKAEYFLKEFEYKKKTKPLKYVGASYGELKQLSEFYPSGGRKVLVDLREKNEDQLINLSIVLSKIEDEYISFYIERFVEILRELQIITEEEYNLFNYGSTEKQEILLQKLGLSMTLINFLKDNSALEEISVDGSGQYHCSQNISNIIENADDMIKFEFNKYFTKEI